VKVNLCGRIANDYLTVTISVNILDITCTGRVIEV